MRIPRIYQPIPLSSNSIIHLDANASNHVVRVLRLTTGAPLILFNGEEGEYTATLINIDKQRAAVKIDAHNAINVESPLHIHLGQGIARGEKMDYIIQKAVELGVTDITPLFTERCEVKLTGERLTKKIHHWQAIAIAACEQSGRTKIATVHPPLSIDQWLQQQHPGLRFVLHHRAQQKLSATPEKTSTHITLFIGPEGGLSPQEIAAAEQHHFKPLQLGPRILRTETASLVAITALQCYFGDIQQ